jgi:uncharacterized protein YjbI with pentapeptide repeats
MESQTTEEKIQSKEKALKEVEEKLRLKLEKNNEELIKLKENLEYSSGVNRSLLIFFLLAMTYFLVIVASTKDLQLLLPNSTVKLPILSVDLDLISFYIFTPFILIVIHFNFLFTLYQHTKKLIRLRELDPTNADPLPHSSFLINLLIKPKENNQAPYFLIRILLWIFIYIYPLFILILFQWRFADYHNMLITFVHFLYILTDIVMLSFFWLRISNPEFNYESFTIFHSANPKDDQNNNQDRNDSEASKTEFDICDDRRDKIDKTFLFFPCFIQNSLYYLKKNTSTANLIVLFLFVLLQIRTFGLLMVMDYLPADVVYRQINKYEYLFIPRLVVVDKPIVDHYRNIELPVPYEDKIPAPNAVESKANYFEKTFCTDKEKEIKSDMGKRVDHPKIENQLDLSNRDLRFAIFDKSDLTGVNLKGAQLHGASLIKTKLNHAELNNAQLQGTNLKNALLINAKLNGATMDEAILEDAEMQLSSCSKASLNGADLTAAKMDCAFLASASFIGAILQNASMICVDANWSIFRAADLSASNFVHAQLQGADFFAADLTGSNLAQTTMVDANLTAANLQGSNLKNSNMLDANLYAANLKDALSSEKTNLIGTDFRYTHLTGSEIITLLNKTPSAKVSGIKIFQEELDKIGQNGSVDLNKDLLKERGVDFIQKAPTPEKKAKQQREIDFEMQEVSYRLRSEIVCDSVNTAKGILKQMLVEKKLDHQRRALFLHLKENCPQIARSVRPE